MTDVSSSDTNVVSSQDGPYSNYIAPPGSPSQPGVEQALEVIRLDEILSVTEVRKQRELRDNETLQQIGNPNLVDIRNRLIQWGIAGFSGDCVLFSITLPVPDICSDGVTRPLSEYIQFISGKTIYEHLDLLRLRLPDFTVSFVYMVGNVLEFRASRG